MGRPTLELGTAGRVRCYRADGGWRAMALYRDFDGMTRQVERQSKTKGGAEQALATALRDRARVDSGSVVTPETRVSDLAEKWFADLQGKSPSTLQAYRDRLDRQIIPALGGVKVRELTVGLVDRHLAAVKAKNGPAVAKMTKSVLSGVCGLAARHDALGSNPCRDTSRISTKPKREPRSLSIEEIKKIRAWFAADKKANDRGLPDLVTFMAGTGLRIGEACGVTWDALDLDAGTVAVRGTILRIKGQGLILKPEPKSVAGDRILELPSWCVVMLRSRQAIYLNDQRAKPPTSAPVFPAPISGNWLDPSNTRRGLREAFAEMGMPGITSHMFRRTVATLMDDAGLSARKAADQLGHAKPSMTQDVYYGRKKRATGAAEVLEALG
jgi:integrase